MCYEQAASDWKAVFHAQQACKWVPVCSAGKLLCLLQCQCVRDDDGVSWITTLLHGLLAHISMIVYWRVAEWKHPLKSGSIFPFTSSCSYLVALHFYFSHTANFSEFFKLAAKIHRQIFNLCVPSSLQPLAEALRASTLRLAVTNGGKKQF